MPDNVDILKHGEFVKVFLNLSPAVRVVEELTKVVRCENGKELGDEQSPVVWTWWKRWNSVLSRRRQNHNRSLHADLADPNVAPCSSDSPSCSLPVKQQWCRGHGIDAYVAPRAAFASLYAVFVCQCALCLTGSALLLFSVHLFFNRRSLYALSSTVFPTVSRPSPIGDAR